MHVDVYRGGPYEPIGADFKGASITVPAGKENVSTLTDALGALGALGH
jgi:hypothetical protein